MVAECKKCVITIICINYSLILLVLFFNFQAEYHFYILHHLQFRSKMAICIHIACLTSVHFGPFICQRERKRERSHGNLILCCNQLPLSDKMRSGWIRDLRTHATRVSHQHICSLKLI